MSVPWKLNPVHQWSDDSDFEDASCAKKKTTKKGKAMLHGKSEVTAKVATSRNKLQQASSSKTVANETSEDSNFEISSCVEKEPTKKGKAMLHGKSEVTAKVASSRNKLQQVSTSSKTVANETSEDSDFEISSCVEKEPTKEGQAMLHGNSEVTAKVATSRYKLQQASTSSKTVANEISEDSNFEISSCVDKEPTKKGKAMLHGKSEVTAKVATSRNKLQQASTSSKTVANEISEDRNFEILSCVEKEPTKKGKAMLHGKSEVTAKVATSRNKLQQVSTSSKTVANETSEDSDFEISSCVEKEPTRTAKAKLEGNSEIRVLKFGDAFSSIADINTKIEEYQRAVNAVYYVRDSTTIEASRKKGITKNINPSLEFYSLKFCCIRGGKKFKSNATGQRSSSSFQINCPAFVRFTLNASGTHLIVAELNECHNHACSKILFQHYPQVRCLTGEEKTKVKALLELGANKKKVQEMISKEMEKVVLLKDLSNIMAQPEGRNNLQRLVDNLQEEHGAEVQVFVDNDKFKGLFFATVNMKRSMDAFGEFIGIDATFKLLNIRAPVYLVIVEDSEGSTEIVAACILMSEDAESMDWFLNCFKTAHPSWPKIKSVMADKDLLERQVIKQHFPSANVLICIFHALRTFNREISCDKLGITAGQRDAAKEIFQQMVYASTDEEYTTLYTRCITELPKSIVTYFDKNWHTIRHEWTLSRDFMQSNFLNTTNNRIESLNGKIKSVVKKYSTLEDFVKNLFILISCLTSERDHKAAYRYLKRRVTSFSSDSPERFYSNLLTQHAFSFIERELREKADQNFVARGQDTFEFVENRSKIHTSSQSCDCCRFSSMSLPCRFIYNFLLILSCILLLGFVTNLFGFLLVIFCRHIFAIREHLGFSLCDETICATRWTQEYYFSKQRVFDSNENENFDVPLPAISSAVPKHRILSERERYSKAFVICKELAGLAAEATRKEFYSRVTQLVDLQTEWQENRTTGFSEETKIVSVPMDDVAPIPQTHESTCVIDDRETKKLPHKSDSECDVFEDQPSPDVIETAVDETAEILNSDDLVRERGEYPCTSGNGNEISEFRLSPEVVKTSVPYTIEMMKSERLIDDRVRKYPRSPETGCKLIENEDDRMLDILKPLQQSEEQNITTFNNDGATHEEKTCPVDFSKILVPPAVKRKGRPKGHDKTVIGLPKKRKIDGGSKKLPFAKRREEEKAITMLKWLVDEDLAVSAVNQGKLIEETSVETRPGNVPHSLIHDDVNIPLIEKYFSKDAWRRVTEIVRSKKHNSVCPCGKCNVDVDEALDEDVMNTAICCDYCLTWYHLSCASLKKVPKTILWKCQRC